MKQNDVLGCTWHLNNATNFVSVLGFDEFDQVLREKKIQGWVPIRKLLQRGNEETIQY